MNIFTWWQLTFTRLVLALFKTFTRLEVHGRENLEELRRPFILTLNHKSMVDSFLVGAAVIRARPDLAPLRFMAKSRLFWYPVLNLLIWSLGAFRVRKKQGMEKSLITPIKIIKNGGAVVIFPEAHINPDLQRLGEGRRGAAMLAHSTAAPILPVSFFVDRYLTLKNFLFSRPLVVVRIGEPYQLGESNPHVTDEKLLQSAKFVMGKIWELYKKDLPRLIGKHRK